LTPFAHDELKVAIAAVGRRIVGAENLDATGGGNHVIGNVSSPGQGGRAPSSPGSPRG
jgi:hypothetical protein